MFRTNLPHSYYIYNTRATRPLSKIKTLTMVKVFTNTRRLPGSNPSHDKNEKRKEKKRTVETWFVSRHYGPRTEVRRGDTPEVLKL